MSGLHNRNILFYSLYPEDKISKECLESIITNDKLKDQFTLLCVHKLDNLYEPPNYRLPNKIIEFKNKNIIPILCVSGFKHFISGKQVLSWLNKSIEKDLNGGLEFYNTVLCGGGFIPSTTPQTF
jgi:hypothetical protein